MEAHLALHCKGPVPDNIRRRWLIEVAKRGEKVNNDKDDEIPIRKKTKTNRSIMSHYQSINNLSFQQSAEITKALLKAFVYCGIPFAIINNPYFRNFLKLLQPGYMPPYKDALSGSLLNRKIARVIVKMEAELQKTHNLTLCKLY